MGGDEPEAANRGGDPETVAAATRAAWLLVAAALVAVLLVTLRWGVTRIYLLNFTTAGPNASALLTLGLITGWILPVAGTGRRALGASVLLAGGALVGTVVAGPGVAAGAAVAVHVLAVPPLVALLEALREDVALAAALGVAGTLAFRAWLNGVAPYAVPAAVAVLLGVALAATALWVHLVRRDRLPTVDATALAVAPGALWAFVFVQGVFLGAPATVSAWALRPYPALAVLSVVGLLVGAARLRRGVPGPAETAGWAVVFLAAMVDLLWLDAVAGPSVLAAQTAGIVLLAAGARPGPGRSARRVAGSLVAVQTVAVALTFLYVAAGNWAYFPGPVDLLVRGRATQSLFLLAALLPVVALVRTVRVDRAPGDRSTSAPSRAGRRTAMGTVGAAALAVAGVGWHERGHPPDTPATPPLRATTFNVHQYLAPETGAYNLRAVRDLLREQDAHVIGLQESDGARLTAGNVRAVEWLADELGYHAASAPTRTQSYGVALLSVWPIESERVVRLPVRNSPPRLALVATLVTPDGPLPVIVTHFQTDRPGNRRVAQAETIVDLAAPHDRALVIGDFNTLPARGEEPHRILSEAFTDAWTAAGNPADAGYTSPPPDPRHRVDYIWLKGVWTVRDVSLAGSARVSDHLAVTATLEPE